jgi:hypothetical protein
MGDFSDTPRNAARPPGVISSLDEMIAKPDVPAPPRKPETAKGDRPKAQSLHLEFFDPRSVSLIVTDDPALDDVGDVPTPTAALAEPLRAAAALDASRSRTVTVVAHPRWFEGAEVAVAYKPSTTLPETASPERRAIHTALIKTLAAKGTSTPRPSASDDKANELDDRGTPDDMDFSNGGKP